MQLTVLPQATANLGARVATLQLARLGPRLSQRQNMLRPLGAQAVGAKSKPPSRRHHHQQLMLGPTQQRTPGELRRRIRGNKMAAQIGRQTSRPPESSGRRRLTIKTVVCCLQSQSGRENEMTIISSKAD
jgi:hypothetical protein